MVTAILQSDDLTARQFAALRRNARRLGVTPQAYLKQLLAEDLAREQVARSTSFHELAAPFRKVSSEVSEMEIDKLIDQLRPAKARSGRR